MCVLGERWCVLMTMTVMMMEAMTNTMVKSMYFPMRGTALEVEGISSTITSRKTVRDSRTEMERVIFSPGDTETDRDGRIYTKSLAKLHILSSHGDKLAHRDLRTGVSRQIEDQPGEKREQHAGNDDVDDEVEGQPQHQEVIGDVQVRRVGAAGVVNPVFPAPVVLQHPFAGLHEVTEVRPVTVLGDRREGNDPCDRNGLPQRG